MTTFLIGYADIPKAATRHIGSANFTLTTTENASYPLANAIDGERYSVFKNTLTSGIQYCTFDLGPTNLKSANYFAVMRADAIFPSSGNVTLRLRGSSDGSSYTSVVDVSNFENTSLVGPDAQDYITTFGASSNYRYWQVQQTYSATGSGNYSKVYFGTLLDLGVDPEDYSTTKVYADSTFIANDGTGHLYRTFPPLIQVRLRWEGVSESAVSTFNTYIAERKQLSTFALYASSYTEILEGNSLLHCKCTFAETSNSDHKVDSNTIEATFLEVKG